MRDKKTEKPTELASWHRHAHADKLSSNWQDVKYVRVDPIRLASFAGETSISALPGAVVDPVAFQQGGRLLVVGLGNEEQGDCGIGSHLLRCLSQYAWPKCVEFRHIGEVAWEQVGAYSAIILLDAMHGPDNAGSVYQSDGEALMACSANRHRRSIEPFLALRRRLTVFGIQPHRRGQDRELSQELVSRLPSMLTYLRHYILQAAAELSHVN